MKLNNKLKLGIGLLVFLFITSCVKDEPSILKIFVKSKSNTHTEGALIRIVGDINKDTPEHLEEKLSNENGVAIFKLDDFFDQYSKNEDKVAFFNVYTKDTLGHFHYTNKVKAKENLTATETVYLKN